MRGSLFLPLLLTAAAKTCMRACLLALVCLALCAATSTPECLAPEAPTLQVVSYSDLSPMVFKALMIAHKPFVVKVSVGVFRFFFSFLDVSSQSGRHASPWPF